MNQKQKYVVRLTEEERRELKEIITKGKAAAYKIKDANILLKADADGPAWPDKKIVESFSVCENRVLAVRHRFVEQGFEAALNRKRQERPSRAYKLDGEAETRLMALRCGNSPVGYSRWNLRLLADKAVELGIVDTISHETVRQALKKRDAPAPEEVLGDLAGEKRGVCGQHGGRPGCVSHAV